MTRILGIDPGSRICGYGLVETGRRGRLEYVECGVLTAPEAWPMEARLGEIARSLGEVIAELEPAGAKATTPSKSRKPRSRR